MTAPDATGWEPLAPTRSAEIRERWGLTGTREQSPRPTTAPSADAAPVQRASIDNAACPEHGVNWTCGCDGCEAALTAPAGEGAAWTASATA